MQLRRRNGSSVVGLMTLMGMAVTALAISTPSVRAVPRKADLAATHLALAMEQARRLALADECDVLLSVDSAGRQLRIAEDANGNGRVDFGERSRWIPLEHGASFAAPPFRVGGLASSGAIAGKDLRIVEGMPTLVMRPDGSASVSGELYLRQAGAGTELRAVTVASEATPAGWYRFDGSRWLPMAGNRATLHAVAGIEVVTARSP